MFKRLKQLLTPTPPAPQGDEILVNAYATVADLPPRDFPHVTGGLRGLADPELAKHLNGFMHHVADAGQGKMTRTRYHVIRHIQRVLQPCRPALHRCVNASGRAWRSRPSWRAGRLR